jgi:hypothetical protein
VTERTSSVNADVVFEPFPIEDVPREVFSRRDRFDIRYRQVGDYGGGTRIGVGIEELEPGKQSCPAHYHMLEEEHLTMLDGALQFIIQIVAASRSAVEPREPERRRGEPSGPRPGPP